VILSGRDLRHLIDIGELRIDGVREEQFQQNGVDLILDDVRRPIDGERAPKYFDTLEFYLGSTREQLTMPNDLMAFVELRSTWARSGLLLPPTIVDAGFCGNLTLEIFAARGGIVVPYGQRFAHLIFARLTGPTTPYSGKYQYQTGVTAPIPDVAP
jgi:dCTP deaminase